MSLAFNCNLGPCLFIHMPRTGGHWLEHVLREHTKFHCWRTPEPATGTHCLPDHHDIAQFNMTFTIIRHPKAWYESIWSFWGAHGFAAWEPGKWHPFRTLEPCTPLGFPKWMTNVLAREPGYLTRYVEQVLGPVGYSRVDRVLKQEDLAEEARMLLVDGGVDWDDAIRASKHPLVNFPTPPRQTPVWEDGLLERVLASEAPLIRRFYNDTEGIV